MERRGKKMERRQLSPGGASFVPPSGSLANLTSGSVGDRKNGGRLSRPFPAWAEPTDGDVARQGGGIRHVAGNGTPEGKGLEKQGLRGPEEGRE